jgi:hypothetical protein
VSSFISLLILSTKALLYLESQIQLHHFSKKTQLSKRLLRYIKYRTSQGLEVLFEIFFGMMYIQRDIKSSILPPSFPMCKSLCTFPLSLRMCAFIYLFVYLTSPSGAQSVYNSIIQWLMTNEWNRIRKKAAVPWFKALSWHVPRDTRVNREKTVTIVDLRPIFEPRASRIRHRNANHSMTLENYYENEMAYTYKRWNDSLTEMAVYDTDTTRELLIADNKHCY